MTLPLSYLEWRKGNDKNQTQHVAFFPSRRSGEWPRTRAAEIEAKRHTAR